MKNIRNSDRLEFIKQSFHDGIVALKDIQLKEMESDSNLADDIALQILTLEEVFKSQKKLVDKAKKNEPKPRGWFSGQIKSKEDRLANIMD